MKRVRCPKCNNYITFDETQYEIVETELPETPFKLLLFSISMMLLLAFVLKV